MSTRGVNSLRAWRIKEVKRLVSEGVSVSKAAKMLSIDYKLAQRFLQL